jgi:hypothetical protein
VFLQQHLHRLELLECQDQFQKLATIRLVHQQVESEFHVLHDLHHVLEIIHLELHLVDHVHKVKDRKVDREDLAMEDRECLDQDQDQFAPVLQHVHNKDLMQDKDLDQVAVEDLVELHHQPLHIEIKVEHHVPDKVPEDRKDLDKVAVSAHHVLVKVHVLVLVAHLEKVAERKRITRVRKLAAKKSTTCKHRPLVVQLFHAVMETLQFACAVAHHWRISLKKLAQIPQH